MWNADDRLIGDNRIPFLGREILDRRDMLDTGIVNEDVDRAELVGAAFIIRFDLGGLGHVGAVVDRSESLASLVDIVRVAEAVDHQLRAFGGQRLRNRKADARGRTGDQRDLAFENHPVLLPALPSARMDIATAGHAAHWACKQEESPMRFGDERESSNFTDDTGRGGFGGGGLGGGGLGCLLPLVASRFGIGGVVVLVIGYFLLSSLGGLGGGTGSSVGPQQQQVGAPAGKSNLDPQIRHFTLQVLASTEDTWTALLQAKGKRYTPTNLHFYSEADQSGCGAAQSAMGPFYCPTDNNIYLDTEFFSELSQRFQAPGDFARPMSSHTRLAITSRTYWAHSARRSSCRPALARTKAMRSR